MAIKRILNALTIDEDVESRRILRQGLTAAGWQVEEAADGLEGLEDIRRYAAEGTGFNCILSAAILPDLDSKLLLRALRSMYPAVPLIVCTAYPEESDRAAIEQLPSTIYLEKPVELNLLLAELAALPLGADTTSPARSPVTPAPRQFEAYAFIRFAVRGQAPALYARIVALPGVRYANAVRGEYDLILRLTAASAEELNDAIAGLESTDGITVAALDKLELPRISAELQELLLHYEECTSAERNQYLAQHQTNAYLIIDIDRFQLERIYTSLIMTEGVISCQVAAKGSKLIVLMSGAVRPEVVRHVLRKVAVMDGIRRVREAPVINISE